MTQAPSPDLPAGVRPHRDPAPPSTRIDSGHGRTVPVVLDTNAALLPFTQGTDLSELMVLVGAHRIVLPSSVQTELQTLAGGNGATARAAAGALKMFAAADVEGTDLPGDDGVLDVASRLDSIVVTNDRRLQAEAGKRGLRVVSAKADGRLARKDRS